MKKNILYLHAGAELYGADKVLLQLIKEVNKSEYNPIIILPSHGPLVEELKRYDIDVRVLGYPILRRKYFNFKGIFKYIKDYFKFSKEIEKIVLKEKIDLIHINTTAVLQGIYLKLKLQIPIVWHVHEIILRPKFINEFICFCLGKYSDRIIVVSDAVKRHLLESRWIIKENVLTIYNGVKSYNEEEIIEVKKQSREIKRHLIGDENQLIVGMIGRINSWKGQEDFLEAVSSVLRNHKNVHCILIGSVFEGEEWREEVLKEKIANSNNSSNIHMISFQKDIINYHMLIDIFVLPSTNPDPLPTVVLEAMSLAKVVVGYNHGGIREMVSSPQKVLSEPKNTNDLAENISYFIDNSEQRIIEGDKNKTRQMVIFNKNNYTSNFLSLYDTVLNKEGN